MCVQVCTLHTHTSTCTNLHKQLLMLTKFSTYLVHVPLVAAVVGVGASVLDMQDRRSVLDLQDWRSVLDLQELT